jgi:hypothetical protein
MLTWALAWFLTHLDNVSGVWISIWFLSIIGDVVIIAAITVMMKGWPWDDRTKMQ